MKFNAFKYVDDLKEAGIPAKQAEAQIKVLATVIESELASKQDIKELDLKIETVKAELKKNIETIKSELKQDIKTLELKIETVTKGLELRLVKTLGSIMVLGIGTIVAIISLTK